MKEIRTRRNSYNQPKFIQPRLKFIQRQGRNAYSRRRNRTHTSQLTEDELILRLDKYKMNYSSWVYFFVNLCKGFELLKHILGEYEATSPTSEWLKVDSIVLSWICMTLSKTVQTWLVVEDAYYDFPHLQKLDHSIIDKMENFKDIYDTLCEGFQLRDRNVWFSLGSNGERTYLTSAAKFSYKNMPVKWKCIQDSRFQKVAKMRSNVSDLNIRIKMRIPFLSPNVNYVVHLIYRFSYRRRTPFPFVNLKYKIGSQTFHAYYAILRNDGWMKIELCRFSNHKENTNFEVLLESFSRTYCGSQCRWDAIYVEGVEFQSIDNVKQEGIDNIMDVRKQLLTDSDYRSENDDKVAKLFELNEVSQKKHIKLPAMDVLYDSAKVKPFHLKPSVESRIQEVIELLPQQVFGIKYKIESRMLTPDTDYMCYLVFKLSEKCRGLHCPVKVQNVLQRKNKDIGLVCFRPTNQWNSNDTYWLPRMREDGWMEVRVWKFNSTSAELRNDRIPMHLRLITYEGNMSGLIVCGLEIRPM